MVSSDVSGIVSDVLVHEGQTVPQGDVLFRIDPEQFKIALDNAKAKLAQTALNLESMKQDYQRMLSDAASQQAQVELAQKTYDRTSELMRKVLLRRRASIRHEPPSMLRSSNNKRCANRQKFC
jgi:membrane fusion protein (multidrug efflux system)